MILSQRVYFLFSLQTAPKCEFELITILNLSFIMKIQNAETKIPQSSTEGISKNNMIIAFDADNCQFINIFSILGLLITIFTLSMS